MTTPKNSSIHCLDLKKQYLQCGKEILQILQQVCEQTAFSGGPFVESFEHNFANWCGAKHCVGLNSGTSALHLAVLALGIKPGDEVIIPANTFIATAWAVSYAGAKPVFVDCDPETWELDVKALGRYISSKTKAIIGVHLYGQPFDVDAVKEIASTHKIPIIEDCAQAHGARYKGHKVGLDGDMGCFSFYPGKNLGACGEGGAIITKSGGFDAHIRKLRNHGADKRYYHDEIGYNYRMDGFQAAALDVKLKYIDAWNNRRREIAGIYRQGLTNPAVTLQHQPKWAESIFHLFVVTTTDRNKLLAHLEERGIHPGLHYPVPCHLQKAYKTLGYSKGDLPNSEYLSDHCLSLPMYPELEDGEVSLVIDAINSF